MRRQLAGARVNIHLSSNPYTQVVFEKIELNLKLEDKRRTAVITGLQIDKQRYRPGETVEVQVNLQPYLETPITQMATIKIPDDTPEGLVTLFATSASSAEWKRSRVPLNFQAKNIN